MPTESEIVPLRTFPLTKYLETESSTIRPFSLINLFEKRKGLLSKSLLHKQTLLDRRPSHKKHYLVTVPASAGCTP